MLSVAAWAQTLVEDTSYGNDIPPLLAENSIVMPINEHTLQNGHFLNPYRFCPKCDPCSPLKTTSVYYSFESSSDIHSSGANQKLYAPFLLKSGLKIQNDNSGPPHRRMAP